VKRHSILLLTLLLVLSLAAAACSRGGKSGGSSDGGDATTLEFWTFNELHDQFYQHMAELWNEKNPDRKVAIKGVVYPYDDMHNKLLVALQSGEGVPDLADVEVNKFPNFLKGTPQLVPLNDIVEPELDNVVKSRFDIYAKDGKYYGIDFHVGATVIYYNKEILDQAGVNPDDIKTWDDYAEAGKKVLEATGKPMTTVELTDIISVWPQVMQAPGLDELQTADGRLNLTSDIVVRPIQYQKKLLDQGIAILTPGGNHHAEEFYGFMNSGGAASIWMPMWYMGRFTDYMPDLKGKMIIKPMPAWNAGEPRSAGMGGTGTVVTTYSKHQDLAKAFLAFAKLSYEGNIEIWRFLGFDPVRSDVWNDPALREPNKFTDYFGDDIFDTLLEVKDEIEGVVINERTPLVTDAFRTTVMVRTLQDGEDPLKVLQEVQAQLQ
jgi:arabinosaccharide transport system substrate-binding protein